LRPTADAVERAKPLPGAADNDKAGVPHRVDLLAVHHPGARIEKIIRLGAHARRLDQHLGIFVDAARLADDRIVRGVVAVADGVDAFALVDHRQGMRKIDGIIAVAPGVERVAVAGRAADHALRFFAFGERHRRQIEAERRGVVEDQFGKSAGAGDDGYSATARPALALAHRKNFGHLVKIVDLDRAMGAQKFGKHPRRAGKAAGMAGDGVLGPFGAADLDDDNRLAGVGGTVERCDIAFRLAHGFGEGGDHLGVRVVDEIVEIIDGARHRFVAGGYCKADAEAAKVGEQRDAHRAALRDDADIADDGSGLDDVLLIGGDARLRVENAHAIRAAHRHLRFARETRDLVLELGAFRAQLGKAAVVNHRRSRAALHRKPHLVRDQRIADAEDDHIRRLRQLHQSRVAFDVEHSGVIRIHRVDRPGESDGAKRLHDGAAGTAAIGGADDRNRTRLYERIKLHWRHLPMLRQFLYHAASTHR
jgi:hypothetical protein